MLVDLCVILYSLWSITTHDYTYSSTNSDDNDADSMHTCVDIVIMCLAVLTGRENN